MTAIGNFHQVHDASSPTSLNSALATSLLISACGPYVVRDEEREQVVFARVKTHSPGVQAAIPHNARLWSWTATISTTCRPSQNDWKETPLSSFSSINAFALHKERLCIVEAVRNR